MHTRVHTLLKAYGVPCTMRLKPPLIPTLGYLCKSSPITHMKEHPEGPRELILGVGFMAIGPAIVPHIPSTVEHSLAWRSLLGEIWGLVPGSFIKPVRL